MNRRISRRNFFKVAGGATTAAILSSCTNTSSGLGPEFVALYSQDRAIVAGLPGQRIPIGVVSNGTQAVDDQSELAVRVLKDGDVIEELTVAAHIVAHDHVATNPDDGHQHSEVNRYFPLRATLPEPGIYDIESQIGAFLVTMPVQAFSRDEIIGLVPGDTFPNIVTPTPDDSAGVDTLCTRKPACQLHTTTPADLLGKQAFALLIATPELCATAYCGPVLETLLGVVEQYPEIGFIHGEVYANVDEVGGNYTDPAIELAPHVKALDLEFEPVLYFVNAQGVIVDRLDNVFDIKELRAELDAL